MKAYLKSDPSSIGEIVNVYTTDYFQKRFTVQYLYGTVIDAAASEFEVLEEDNNDL